VMEYQRLGYLPEAMVNFLSLLGWSPGDDREVLTRDQLIAAFTLEGISGGNAVFNAEKLDWFNQQHIVRLPIEDLASRVEPILREAGLWREELAGAEREWFFRVLALVRPRVRKLDQFVEELRPFLDENVSYDASAVTKHLSKPEVRDAVTALSKLLAGLEPFTQDALEAALRALAEDTGVKAASLIHATRVAVTGRAVSPGLFEVLELLGRDRSSARVRNALRLLPQ
jgi:glutamyl/glutaminyl-tRNA synthetase